MGNGISLSLLLFSFSFLLFCFFFLVLLGRQGSSSSKQARDGMERQYVGNDLQQAASRICRVCLRWWW